MEKKGNLNVLYEIIAVCFIPFIVVIFIEFVLKLGMGPFVERLSFFLPLYASLISICSYVWIRKGIVYAVLPIIVFSLLISLYYKNALTIFSKIIYFFISIVVLSFTSILCYAFSKVIGKYRSSYTSYVLQFFIGLFFFVCALLIIHITRSFSVVQITMFQSAISGVREGLVLGSGVIIVIIILAQKMVQQ